MRAAVVVVIVCVAALAGTAGAQEEVAEARKHFEQGTKAYNLGEFERAVKEYREAYNAKPDPAFLYNIAQAYRLSNDVEHALFFYRSFLRNMPDAANRREVEGRIKALEQQQHVMSSPPNNPVAPGSAPLAPTPKPETPDATTTSAAAPPTVPAPTVPAPTVPAPGPAVVVEAAPPPPPEHKSRVGLIVGITVGAVVLVAVGVGLGVGLSGGGNSAPSTHFGTTVVHF